MQPIARVCLLAAILSFSVFSGCDTTSVASEALAMSEQSLEWRTMQSRKYETTDERMILNSSAALLQDLGFTIDETESELGLLVGSKDRSAVEAGQIVGSLILAALTGAYMPTDHHQRFKASVVTRLYGENNDSVIVRVTFQRIVWNDQNQISKIERINDESMYVEFFSKLSKAIFLEGQQI